MAENFSFDIVSDFDRQELVNTLDQVKREISQRYDLKGTDTKIELGVRVRDPDLEFSPFLS